jgi:glycosyltransferase involved in cell wall biosynthesis
MLICFTYPTRARSHEPPQVWRTKPAKRDFVLSVVIATQNSERPLVTTLAALVPGATAGMVREVIVADGGSRDQTREVADIAGCRIVVLPQAPVAARLAEAAKIARSPWLMFLRPGVVPDPTWIGEIMGFIEAVERSGHAETHAAAFRGTRSVDALRPALAEAFSALAAALRRWPRPEQGLLINRRGYETLGGHRAGARNPERDLMRRIGRRRIVLLRCGVAAPQQLPDT